MQDRKDTGGLGQKPVTWQMTLLVLAGVGVFYGGGTLLYIMLGNPSALDYRQAKEFQFLSSILFFGGVPAMPLLYLSHSRAKKAGRDSAMPDRLAGLPLTAWLGFLIVGAGVLGTIVSYVSVDPHAGGTYVVFWGMMAYGVFMAIRGFFH